MSYRYIGSNTEDLQSGDYVSTDQVDFNSPNYIEEIETEGMIKNGDGGSFGGFGDDNYNSIWDQGYLSDEQYGEIEWL